MKKISEELSTRLLKEGINPSDVVSITTRNNKHTKLIITKIELADGSHYELIDDFVWYASRKDKTW